MYNENKEEKFFREKFKDNYTSNIPLSLLSYIRIGGVARHLVKVENEKHLEIVQNSILNRFPFQILGKASNTLISDSGVPTLVIIPYWQPAGYGLEIAKNDTVELPAGMPLARAVRITQQAGFYGLEFAFGIPGSVGGGICMNAGADGSDIRNVLHSALVLRDGSFKWVSADSLNLNYRSSNILSKEIVAAGRFSLKRLGSHDEKVEIRKKCLVSLQKRKKTQPLGMPSLGSTFKNPPGAFAAELIEQCNLKGERVGGIAVSKLHANFIVNDGTGTSQEALGLIGKIRETVKEKTGILLETEVRTMGFL